MMIQEASLRLRCMHHLRRQTRLLCNRTTPIVSLHPHQNFHTLHFSLQKTPLRQQPKRFQELLTRNAALTKKSQSTVPKTATTQPPSPPSTTNTNHEQPPETKATNVDVSTTTMTTSLEHVKELENVLDRMQRSLLVRFDSKACLVALDEYMNAFNSQSSLSSLETSALPKMDENRVFELLTKILKNPREMNMREIVIFVYRFCVKHDILSRNPSFLDLLICVCIKERQPLLFDELNRYSKKHAVPFNKNMLQFQLSAYTKGNYTNHAMHIFEQLIAEEVPIDLPFYTILLDHLKLAVKEVNHYREYCFTVLNHLRDKRIPNYRLLHSIFSLLGTLSDAELTNWWFKRVTAMNFTPDIKIATCMVQSLKGSGSVDTALLFIKQMENQYGLKVDEILVNCLINCSNSFDQAFAILRGMENDFHLRPNIFHFSSVLKLVQNESDMKVVISLMQHMNVPPSVVTYTEIINFYCRNNLKDHAIDIYNQVKKMAERDASFKPTIYMISQLVSTFKNDAYIANLLYQDLLYYEQQPTRGLLLQFLHSSPEFRETHIDYILAPTHHVDYLNSIHKLSPSFFHQLLKWMTENSDRRFLQVQSQLPRLRIAVKQ